MLEALQIWNQLILGSDLLNTYEFHTGILRKKDFQCNIQYSTVLKYLKMVLDVIYRKTVLRTGYEPDLSVISAFHGYFIVVEPSFKRVHHTLHLVKEDTLLYEAEMCTQGRTLQTPFSAFPKLLHFLTHFTNIWINIWPFQEIGSTKSCFSNTSCSSWKCLQPDLRVYRVLTKSCT